MLQVGLSACGKPLNRELFEQYRDAGITEMEISCRPEELLSFDPLAVAEMARATGVHLFSFHLPFLPFNVLDLSSPELADATVAHLSSLIRRVAQIGIKLFIVHPSAEPIADGERAVHMECAKASLRRLAEVADEFGAVLAVEDLPRTNLGRNSDEMLELLSADPRLRACFDTNHLFEEDPVHFIRALGDKIVTTHVSDFDLLNERHWLPGEGVVDWTALVSALQEIGYRGPWLYELGFSCPATVNRERPLTCADFVNNAREIFEGRPITRLSTPVEGLKAWR